MRIDGVIREDNDRIDYDALGQTSYYDLWKVRDLRRIISNLDHIMIYDIGKIDLSWLNEEDTLEYQRRQKYRNGLECLKEMSAEMQRDFLRISDPNITLDDFVEDYRKIELNVNKGIPIIKDLRSPNFSFQNNHRIGNESSDKRKKRILFFGPCTILGAYVSNENTISSLVYKFMRQDKITDYEVVNCGTMSWEYLNGRLCGEKIFKDDLIVYFGMEGPNFYWNHFRKVYFGDFSDLYRFIKNPMNHMLESPRHCDASVNRIIAERVYNDIAKCIDRNKKTIEDKGEGTIIAQYHIPFSAVKYYHEKNVLINNNRITHRGGIVMNCNPFTLGHRYLIQAARKCVEELIVFVVEEDASFFSFYDRLEMVKQGCDDLDVIVIPSGRWIISKNTFKEYFDKDSSIAVSCDMEYDICIFGEVVSKEFGIKVRFVGQEPYDIITRNYNEKMKEILPHFGVNVVEIERKTDEKGEIISATKVRNAIFSNNSDCLIKMCPESTIKYLMKYNYINDECSR